MSTLRTISNFKSNMIGGGARPNLFEVAIPALQLLLQQLVQTGEVLLEKSKRLLTSSARQHNFLHLQFLLLMFHSEEEFLKLLATER